MSVFVRNPIIEFRAPIAISQQRVALQGSWFEHVCKSEEISKMSPTMLFHLRLHTWPQQIKNHRATSCLDWCIELDNTNIQHYVILRFNSSLECYKNAVHSIEFNNFIDKILNSSSIVWTVHQAIEQSSRIQQAQPGVDSMVDGIGK